MKKEWADKWVAALRSGKYQQTRGVLYDGVGYCCLGVLCEVTGRKFVRLDGSRYFVEGTYHDALLPLEVQDEVGLASDIGRLRSSRDSLVELNDDKKKSFEEIADIIETHWEEL